MHQYPTNHLAGVFQKHNGRQVVRVSASVEIGVEPGAVFELVTDLRRKTSLSPHTAVLDITRRPDGPVDVGTVFHHRIAVDGHIGDYRNRVVELSPGRRMVTESDSSPPFRIVVIVEPIASGARLTQEETFPLTELVVPVPQASGWIGKLLRFMFGDDKVIRQGSDSLAREVEEMQYKLQPRLEAWLNSIKADLEEESRQLRA